MRLHLLFTIDSHLAGPQEVADLVGGDPYPGLPVAGQVAFDELVQHFRCWGVLLPGLG